MIFLSGAHEYECDIIPRSQLLGSSRSCNRSSIHERSAPRSSSLLEHANHLDTRYPWRNYLWNLETLKYWKSLRNSQSLKNRTFPRWAISCELRKLISHRGSDVHTSHTQCPGTTSARVLHASKSVRITLFERSIKQSWLKPFFKFMKARTISPWNDNYLLRI
jgi:hypothetical protein